MPACLHRVEETGLRRQGLGLWRGSMYRHTHYSRATALLGHVEPVPTRCPALPWPSCRRRGLHARLLPATNSTSSGRDDAAAGTHHEQYYERATHSMPWIGTVNQPGVNHLPFTISPSVWIFTDISCIVLLCGLR